VNSLKGLVAVVGAAVVRPFRKKDPSIPRVMLAFVLLGVQLLVLALVLCVVGVLFLYVLGLYISTGISLWRLTEHDYGNPEGGTNLKPALNVLYSLAVAQGVVFGYKSICDLVAKAGIVEDVASCYSLDTALVSDYLEETVTGCMKDPSFTRGRNLITYAVNLLMESKSRYGYLSGVVILGTTLSQDRRTAYWLSGQPGLIEELLTGSASFSHVVQTLLETFGPTSPYSTVIREHAASIVANVAGSIRLEEQFPGGAMIQCILSLLDTFHDYSWQPEGYVRPNYVPKECEREWLLEEKGIQYLRTVKIPRSRAAEGYKGRLLVVQGLRILQRLAIHEDNCRVISSTQGLLSKIMAPLISEQLHRDHHDEWSSMAEESLELMNRLMLAPAETKSKLKSGISGTGQPKIADILECSKCRVSLKRQSVKIILDLSRDTISVTSGGSNDTMFMGLVLHIFLLPDYCFRPEDSNYYGKMRGSTHLAKKSSYVRKLAGEKLQAVLSFQNESSATSVLESSVFAVAAYLTRTSVDAANNITCRLNTVRVLADLFQHYKEDDEYFKELKKAMADVIPQVLKQIVGFASNSSAEIHAKTEANDLVSAQEADVEKGFVPLGNGQEGASSSQQQNGEKQHEGIKLQEALISLCLSIPYRWGREFDDLAKKTCFEQGISIPDDEDFFSLVRYARGLVEEQKEAQGLVT